jgi:hypothetical protein
LVSCERGSSGEGLLAVDVGAFVGSLARVDSPVSGKGAGVAERLQSMISLEEYSQICVDLTLPQRSHM